ncbi:MAG: MXAN_6640 family putative metalloprotease [Myxococcota bacterium]|nr:MXAN_6640 family putative metalloprotease [Myxococcota bacterium]
MIFFLTATVFAERPDEGGLFSFDSSDVLSSYDSDHFRVHFSVDGPNQTRLEDEDASGVPDFVEMVAQTAEEAFEVYRDAGFLEPLPESELGVVLGGTEAFDFYLVDFGGSADGMFGIDDCIDHRCVGYMVMENDFVGYGYPSTEEAVRVLVSHEYFHAVQSAYRGAQDSWLSEGMAVWAEYYFDPQPYDFYGFCSAYLDDPERSLFRPPAGMVTAFSYGTALWFAFLYENRGVELLVEIQEEQERQPDSLQAMVDAVGEDLEPLWIDFTRWNLATGGYAGAATSYPYAERINPPTPSYEGSHFHDEHRFYPLAASYFRLDHEGGELRFHIEDGAPGITFSLHATDGFQVQEPISMWSGETFLSWSLEAGSYWIVGSYGSPFGSSQKLELCIGADCDEPEVESPNTKQDGGCGGQAGILIPWFFFWGIRRVRKRNKEFLC